ncbi:PAS domain S-box protein [Aerosakkonemataceae cyanobacterium BLCC-F154]|uniref:histidine kinase n=1 Tax=Floridaenema fluviatile BLCC-F154 TaxID=3153640 RepID=A0ABV4YCI1_9CYAN
MSLPLDYNSRVVQPSQLRMLLETALDAIALIDDRGYYLDVNSAACELFGLNRDKLLERCISEFVESGFDFPTTRQELQQQEKVRGEFHLLRSDGEIRVVEYAATANFLPQCHLFVMRDMTSCKQAEAQIEQLSRQLAQAQAQLQEAGIEPVSVATPAESHRLEQIARHIPGVIYQFRMRPDGTTYFSYASEGLRTIYGFSPEELQEDASKIFTVVHPEDLDRVTQSILESAKNLTPWYCEHRVSFPDGRMLWLIGHSTPQRQPDGSTLWHGYIRDITDRKRTEAYNQRLLAILESTSDLIGIADLTGKTVYLNRAWRNLLNINDAAIANLEVFNLHPKSALDIILNQGLPEAAHSGSWQGETAILTPTGDEIPVSQVIVAHKSTDGEVEYFSTIIRDITESKATEIALRNSLKELSDIKFALDQAAIVAITDEQGIIKYANNNFCQISKYSREELIGQDHRLIKSNYHPPEFFQNLWQTISSGKVWQGEIKNKAKDGSCYWVNTTIVPLLNEHDKPTQYLAIRFDITSQKEAEAKLIETTQLQEAILNGTNYTMISTDPNGIIKTINAAGQEVLGYSSAELVDKVTPAIIHDLEEVKQRAIELSAELGKPIEPGFEVFVAKARLGIIDENEWSYIRKDGSRFPVQLSVTALRDPEGTITGFLGIGNDITQRQQAEAQLKEISQRLSLALKSGKIGCWEWNFVDNTLVWDDRMYELYGVSKKSETRLAYDIWATGLHPEDRETSEKLIQQAALGKAEFNVEFRVVHPDDSIHYIKAFGLVQRDAEGNAEKMIGVNFDITDRKRQEQALRLIVEGTAAKTGEGFFKSCVQYIAQVLDVRYAFIAEFVKGEKLLAKTLAFWAGDDIGDNFTYNLVGAPCENIYVQGDLCLYPNSVRSLFPKDLDLVTLQAESYAGLPIIDAAGNRLGLLAVLDNKPMVQDITMQSAILKIFATRAGAELERIKAEEALRQKTAELETTLNKLQTTQTRLIQAEKMSSLGELVAGIAHEINNPVSFIYSNIQPATDYSNNLIELIQLYQEYYPSPPPAISSFIEDIEFDYLVSDFSKLLMSMKSGATRIRDIVKSLRTFSRLDEADFKEIDIHENIESTLVILQNKLNGRAGNPEIIINKNYGKLPLVECFGGLLNQVFMNLLMNAIDAIEQQRQSLSPKEKLDYIGIITITTSITPKNQVLISIHDNGCGMNSQVKEKIFNPFFTTKPVGKGTGMGLAISYQIVTENHQGHLRCFSTVGKGTEFQIELPIREQR